MVVSIKQKPKVRISYDEMEAYLFLPTPTGKDTYVLKDILELLKFNGVKFGVDEAKVSVMIRERLYDREYIVAQGIEVIDGVDAFFDFHFDTNFNRVPTHRVDGSVDYWSIHSVELVEQGQPIATYHPPVDGVNGMNVKGKILYAKKGRPLPPLTGKGFARSEDNLHYTSMMDGKIEMQKNRIMISAVHEVYGDVGLGTGNIDFRGDIIIHGNVLTGAAITATGSITVEGMVEGALIDANKDVIIRGGMIGASRGVIKSRGNVHVKFLEYATVEAEGALYTDAAIYCDITVNDKVYLKGKHASVVGGTIHAATGVEAMNFGNDYGVKTEVYVGVNHKLKEEINYHEDSAKEAQDMLDKINQGLKQIDDAIKEGVIKDSQDPRKASLLRTKIVKQAELASHTQILNKMNQLVENAEGASISVFNRVHSGVIVGINDAVHSVNERQDSVSFVERNGHVVMFSLRSHVI